MATEWFDQVAILGGFGRRRHPCGTVESDVWWTERRLAQLPFSCNPFTQTRMRTACTFADNRPRQMGTAGYFRTLSGEVCILYIPVVIQVSRLG